MASSDLTASLHFKATFYTAEKAFETRDRIAEWIIRAILEDDRFSAAGWSIYDSETTSAVYTLAEGLMTEWQVGGSE